MIRRTLQEVVPGAIKHPLISFTRWYWQLRTLPQQSVEDINIFKQVLSNACSGRLRVFEWGTGLSTVYYPTFLKSIGREFEWHSIDNSAVWHQKISVHIRKRHLSENVQVYCSEFPAFFQLPGYSASNPIPSDSYCNHPSVAKYVSFPIQLGEPFNVIIIDGRFRRRCLMVAKEAITSNGIVILHDADRSHYYPPLASYPHHLFIQSGTLPGSRQKSMIAIISLQNHDLFQQLKPWETKDNVSIP